MANAAATRVIFDVRPRFPFASSDNSDTMTCCSLGTPTESAALCDDDSYRLSVTMLQDPLNRMMTANHELR